MRNNKHHQQVHCPTQIRQTTQITWIQYNLCRCLYVSRTNGEVTGLREDRNKIVLYWNFYPLLFCVYTVWICIIHVRDKVPCICDFLCSEQTSICLAFSIWFGEFGCLLRFTNCILVVVGLDFVLNFLGCTFL